MNEPRKEFLDLALSCGAKLTGKPDGSEAVTVVFTADAWRAFDAACLSQARATTERKGEPVAWCLGDPRAADSSNVFLSHQFTPDSEHLDEWCPLYASQEVPEDTTRLQALEEAVAYEKAQAETYFKLYNAACETAQRRLQELVRLESSAITSPQVPEGLTPRHCQIAAFALYRLSCDAHRMAEAAAQKSWRGKPDDHLKFAADAKDADEARSILLAAAKEVPNERTPQ